jgi:hypothetical protein
MVNSTFGVNYNKYPINEKGSSEYNQLVRICQVALSRSGVAVLEDFIDPISLPLFVREAQGLVPLAFHNKVEGNCYLTESDLSFPPNHPRRRIEVTSLGAVAYDLIPSDSHIIQLYNWEATKNFISDVVGIPLYQYACPMGAVNITVMGAGDYLRWHFDLSSFVVSIPLQESESGGEFEMVRWIRSPDDEQYERVQRVLDGDHAVVEVLKHTPGSLVLFEGMYTLHRVTPINGPLPRLGALLAYVNQPGMTSTPYLRKIRYGRE